MSMHPLHSSFRGNVQHRSLSTVMLVMMDRTCNSKGTDEEFVQKFGGET